MHWQILIIFGTYIPGTTGHQTTIQYVSYLTRSSILLEENGTHEVGVEINKKTVKTSLTLSIVTWRSTSKFK